MSATFRAIDVRTSCIEFDSLTTPKTPQGGFKSPAVEKNPVSDASLWTLFVISMPRMAIRMAWASQWTALGPYLQTLLPRYAVQLTQLIGPLTGILVSPIVGVYSDQCTSKYGRRRPFLVAAAVSGIICFTLMGFTREIGDALGDYGSGKHGEETDRTWTAVVTILLYLWIDITINLAQTPAALLISDFAGTRQTTGAALAHGWTTLGAIVVSSYTTIFGPAYESLHCF